MRRQAAWHLREKAKEQARLSHFISIQPSSDIMPISRDTLKDIYEKVAESLPKNVEFPEQVKTPPHLPRYM